MPARAVFGRLGGSFKVAVSKPGFDVLTTSSSNLLLDSDRTHVRIIQSGSFVLTAGGTVNITISGQGSSTLFVHYGFLAPTTALRLPLNQGVSYSLSGSTLTFTRSSGSSGGPITIRYSVWGI